MHITLADFTLNAPIVIMTFTALLAMIVEAGTTSRPVATYGLSLAGIAGAAYAAALGLTPEQPTFNGMLSSGVYGNFFALVVLLSAGLTVLFARRYLESTGRHRGDFYILVLFAAIGMMLMASANDLMIVFLGVELMSVCLYVLAGYLRTKARANEAALKYFLLGAFATGFLLYGIALIYGTTGTTNLLLIARRADRLWDNTLFVAGAGLLSVGFAFKVAAVPFHWWAPDVYEGSPTPVTAFMATGAKAAGFAAFFAVIGRALHPSGLPLNEVLAAVSAATMILGNVVAIAQSNIKRMLAYSSIAHAGYILAGLAAGNPEGQSGMMFYVAAYAVMNLGAFGIVGLMERTDDTNLAIDDYAGLSRQRPVIAALMAMFMFSLAGIPPFAGFFGKYYVFLAAVHGGLTWLAVVGVLTSAVSAYYYLRLVVVMYFREGNADISDRPTLGVAGALTVSALLVLLFGLLPSTVLDLIR